eukprot:ctg_471.g276
MQRPMTIYCDTLAWRQYLLSEYGRSLSQLRDAERVGGGCWSDRGRAATGGIGRRGGCDGHRGGAVGCPARPVGTGGAATGAPGGVAETFPVGIAFAVVRAGGVLHAGPDSLGAAAERHGDRGRRTDGRSRSRRCQLDDPARQSGVLDGVPVHGRPGTLLVAVCAVRGGVVAAGQHARRYARRAEGSRTAAAHQMAQRRAGRRAQSGRRAVRSAVLRRPLHHLHRDRGERAQRAADRGAASPAICRQCHPRTSPGALSERLRNVLRRLRGARLGGIRPARALPAAVAAHRPGGDAGRHRTTRAHGDRAATRCAQLRLGAFGGIHQANEQEVAKETIYTLTKPRHAYRQRRPASGDLLARLSAAALANAELVVGRLSLHGPSDSRPRSRDPMDNRRRRSREDTMERGHQNHTVDMNEVLASQMSPQADQGRPQEGAGLRGTQRPSVARSKHRRAGKAFGDPDAQLQGGHGVADGVKRPIHRRANGHGVVAGGERASASRLTSANGGARRWHPPQERDPHAAPSMPTKRTRASSSSAAPVDPQDFLGGAWYECAPADLPPLKPVSLPPSAATSTSAPTTSSSPSVQKWWQQAEAALHRLSDHASRPHRAGRRAPAASPPHGTLMDTIAAHTLNVQSSPLHHLEDLRRLVHLATTEPLRTRPATARAQVGGVCRARLGRLGDDRRRLCHATHFGVYRFRVGAEDIVCHLRAGGGPGVRQRHGGVSGAAGHRRVVGAAGGASGTGTAVVGRAGVQAGCAAAQSGQQGAVLPAAAGQRTPPGHAAGGDASGAAFCGCPAQCLDTADDVAGIATPDQRRCSGEGGGTGGGSVQATARPVLRGVISVAAAMARRRRYRRGGEQHRATGHSPLPQSVPRVHATRAVSQPSAGGAAERRRRPGGRIAGGGHRRTGGRALHGGAPRQRRRLHPRPDAADADGPQRSLLPGAVRGAGRRALGHAGRQQTGGAVSGVSSGDEKRSVYTASAGDAEAAVADGLARALVHRLRGVDVDERGAVRRRAGTAADHVAAGVAARGGVWDEAAEEEEEHFVDVDRELDADDETCSKVAIPSPALPKPTYDITKRDPKYAGAEHTRLWELLLLRQHAHPTVCEFARTLLSGQRIEYSGDPVEDHTLSALLGRLSYRRRDRQERKGGGDRQRQPMNTYEALVGGREAVSTADRFLYDYFERSGLRERILHGRQEDAESEREEDDVMEALEERDIENDDEESVSSVDDLSEEEEDDGSSSGASAGTASSADVNDASVSDSAASSTSDARGDSTPRSEHALPRRHRRPPRRGDTRLPARRRSRQTDRSTAATSPHGSAPANKRRRARHSAVFASAEAYAHLLTE